MQKILGLDLGVSSIGWAIIQQNTTNTETNKITFVEGGIKIIPYNSSEGDDFSKGKSITINQNRTIARGARRLNDRYKMRRYKLRAWLKERNMLPTTDPEKDTALYIYGLRHRSVTEQIPLSEIGRVFLHLNQRRGYKSNRKSDAEESKKQSDYLEKITKRTQTITENDQTIGQYFYNMLQDNAMYRVKDEVFPRERYIQEFDKIWNTQAAFYPEIFNKENLEKVRNEYIYFQRDLRSQKHLVSMCEFEKGSRVAPRSSPIAQLCKIWEDVNKLKITDAYNRPYSLTLEQKTAVVTALNKSEKLSESALFKILNLSKNDGYKTNRTIEKSGIQGNKTRAKLIAILGENHPSLAFDLVEKIDLTSGKVLPEISEDCIKTPYYLLWQLLYSIDDKAFIANALRNKCISDEQIKQLCALDFTTAGFGNKSTKMMRRILPYLLQGMLYSEACEAASYNHSFSLTKEENSKRILDDSLKLLKKGALRQPIVEKIINQLIHLVNSLMEKHGKFDEIRVELARDLRNSKEEREQMEDNNKKQEKKHKQITEILTKEYNIQKVTRKHIEKYKLWEETGEISPYTGQTVCLAKLLHGEGFDVEHIIPQARLFDNSFGNKTICERFVNQEKSSQTAFDFMKSRGEQEFNRYIEVVNRLHKDKKISRSKFAKLLMSAADIPDDFINRQLGETRYISRKAVEILKSVCTHVHTTTGSVTAYLRREWGWDLALEKVNIPTYAAQGKTYTQISGSGNTKTRIVDWSKRDDHRHHFVDALTIACTKQAYIQRLNKLNTLVMGGSQAEKFAELKKININAEKPFETAAVMEMLEGIFIAYKPGQNVGTWNKNKKTGQIALAPRGALHKETVYGQIKRYPKSPTKLNKKFINAQFIIDEAERKTVLARLENYQFDAQKALDKLEKNPILVNGKPLTEVRVWEYEIVVKYKLNDSFIEKDIPYIVDSVIKKIVQQRFDEYKAADIKEHPLKSMAQNPIYLNKEKGICINSVRCFTGLKSLVPLHKNKYGEPIDFVSTSKNHHIAIYENENGERNERVVTFWDAVERMKQGIEVVQTEDPEFGKLVLSMQQNEMFVFDMTVTELQEAIKSNHKKIGKNLYRVQKISKTDYYFRQHIATHINNNNQMKRISSLKNLNCIKVHINRLGEIVKIGE